ncbi:MAG: PAS domain S-box protein [Proteobacteria bacterium]|nr:PAS domain S-box protein [Pseudomonadota bacterium]
MLDSLGEMDSILDEQVAVEAVRRSEELLRAVFNSSPELVCVTTIFGEFVEANEAFCKACGLAREDILGKPGSAINLWVDLERRHEFLTLLGKHAVVSCFGADMRHHSGKVIPCLLFAHVIKVHGTVLVVTTAKDISNACPVPAYL